MSEKTTLSADELEQLHLSDNGYVVSYAALVALPQEGLSPLSMRSPHTDFVLRIETKERPDASPFHFWMTHAQLRRLMAEASLHIHQEQS